MCVEQQLAIIVTGKGKMDDQDDRPLASGSATETHPRSAIFKSHSPLRLHEAYGSASRPWSEEAAAWCSLSRWTACGNW